MKEDADVSVGQYTRILVCETPLSRAIAEPNWVGLFYGLAASGPTC